MSANNNFLIHFYDPESGGSLEGILINSTYCAVRDSWILLLHCQDGKFRSIKHDSVDVTADWLPGDLMFVEGDDGDSEDEYDD